MVRSVMLKIYAGLEYLRQRPGQKHMVFLGHRLPLQDKAEERRLAQRVNHAQVTMHIISTAGTPANSTTSRAAQLVLVQLGGIQGMQYLTAETGGGYTGLRFANQALADIDRASRSYYLIGYQPVSAEDDGRYRRVDVRVARRDVNVRHRSGYYATGQPHAPVLPELLALSRMETVADFDIEIKDIKVTGTATFTLGKHPAGEVAVKFSIDPSRLGLETGGGFRAGRLGMTLLGMDGRGGLLGGGGGTLDVKADDEMYKEYLTNGIPVSLTLPVSERPRHIKVIVYAYGSDLMGVVNLPVR